ncbi:hypothetical protein QYM36_016048 [Artemia franciscana]|uniref:PiggyBac transposable element-derived protein domain-containing protein n=1 Tax=Artemia franciscana TaxID=6661 RepID=A0AA88HHU0_ARTSF|nr:hypothetical protein QYM36_016048 [Artemia franciscana]
MGRVETNSGIVATKWLDNKGVCIASSFVGAEPSGNCKHWDSMLKKHIDVDRLLCIAECNKITGGVDLTSYGSAWPNPQKELLDFKSKIAIYLFSTSDATPRSRGRPLRDQDCCTPKRPKLAKPKPYDSVHYDGIQHWPEAVADKKQCRLCSAYARIQCSKCQISLCLVQKRNRFKIFHTQ